MIDLSSHIGGIKLKNPVITASGTFGFGREYGDLYDLSKLGAITVKGITYKPRGGNIPPRIAETSSGILNSVGLENPGIDAFISTELPNLKKFNVPIIANISGNTIEEFAIMAEMLNKLVDFIELNVSCPNVKEGGMAFGIKADSIYKVTSAAKNFDSAYNSEALTKCNGYNRNGSRRRDRGSGLFIPYKYRNGNEN